MGSYNDIGAEFRLHNGQVYHERGDFETLKGVISWYILEYGVELASITLYDPENPQSHIQLYQRGEP